MGRISIFSGNDLHSKRVIAALEARNLPFTEISVIKHPNKVEEIHALSSRRSVPQVFFNTRFVGGADETIKELQHWDKPSAKYSSPLDRFHREIGSLHEPINKAFQVQDQEPTPGPREIEAEELPILLPDGTSTTVWDITERLKNSLPFSDIKRNNAVYRMGVTGQTIVKEFKVSLGLSTEQATRFGQHLLNANILVQYMGEKVFECSEKEIYRLQCLVRPDVLNSYRVWEDVSVSSCEQVFDNLDTMLHEIEMDCVDKSGKIDYLTARRHGNFARFEDAMCELQIVGFRTLQRKNRLAFGLNIYNLMMRYALVKLGVPRNETARNSLVSSVKFAVGGKRFSFNDWLLRVIKPSMEHVRQKSWLGFEKEIGGTSKIDHRIFIAINAGPSMGSSMSLPFRKYSASEVDKQLDLASQAFFEDKSNLSINIEDGQLILSKVFLWYRADLPRKDTALIEMLVPSLGGLQKSGVEQVLARKRSFKLTFSDVDYTLNASNFSDYDEGKVTAEVKGLRALLRRFKIAPKPKNESLRRETLRKLDLLDSLPEERFDRITRMVKSAFNVPLVFVSLVDDNRQWFKSSQWACPPPEAVTETPRDVAMCAHTILQPTNDIMWIEDTSEDERFADNPAVTGLNIRFYAGCNLSIPSSNGELVNIGTLCILDHVPRDVNDKDLKLLKVYASQVKNEILRMDRNIPSKGGEITKEKISVFTQQLQQ